MKNIFYLVIIVLCIISCNKSPYSPDIMPDQGVEIEMKINSINIVKAYTAPYLGKVTKKYLPVWGSIQGALNANIYLKKNKVILSATKVTTGLNGDFSAQVVLPEPGDYELELSLASYKDKISKITNFTYVEPAPIVVYSNSFVSKMFTYPWSEGESEINYVEQVPMTQYDGEIGNVTVTTMLEKPMPGLNYSIVGWGLERNPAIDLRDHSYVVLYHKGRQGGEKFGFGLESRGKQSFINITASDQWQRIEILLSDFSFAVDKWEDINRPFVIKGANQMDIKKVFYIDQVIIY